MNQHTSLDKGSSEVSAPVIELENVRKSFPLPGAGQLVVLETLSLTLQQQKAGEIVVLLGTSGCGKSTILKLISGLLQPDTGEVRVYGVNITGPNPYSATVSQGYTCFPWLTVLQNVEFGLALQNMPRQERHDRAMHYLEKVDLLDRYKSFPKELSGGMQQRVAIARTLAVQRPIVLMDEPFGALDAQTREEMQQMLLGLWMEERSTIVFVTHDISEAVMLADRILICQGRPVQKLDEVSVDFPRPRSPHLLRNEDFIRLCEQLRLKLKNEHSSSPLGPEIVVSSAVPANFASLG